MGRAGTDILKKRELNDILWLAAHTSLPVPNKARKKNRADFCLWQNLIEPTEARRLHLRAARDGRPLEVTGTPPDGSQRTSRGAYCTQAYGVRKSES
jgi:hypothetical protein